MTKPDWEKFRELVALPKNRRNLNYLLVMPSTALSDEMQYNFPLGIAYVSAALKVSGRNIFTLNLNYKKQSIHELLASEIQKNNIDIVFSGGLTTQYKSIKDIFDVAKEIKPNIVNVAGGGIITSDPVHAMQALETVDYGIIGEGEITSCKLCDALETNAEVTAVNGIIFSVDGGGGGYEYMRTNPCEEIIDLDIIPWPDYDGFEYEKMLDKLPFDFYTFDSADIRFGMIASARSCPMRCTFCFHPTGSKYRTRSADSFFLELEYIIERYKINILLINDELLFNNAERNMKRAKEFCFRLKDYGVSWVSSLRVSDVTYELVELMKDCGCIKIAFGLESANDAILRSMRKNTTVKQIDFALKCCLDVGVRSGGCFIFGDLEETYETAMNTINWWKAHPQYDNIKCFWISVYPGTYLYEQACKTRIISDPVRYIKSGCPIINLSKMSNEQFAQIDKLLTTLSHEKHDILANAKLTAGRVGAVNLKGCCPYCGKEGDYFDLDPFRPLQCEFCPHCQKMLRIYGCDYSDPNVVENNIICLIKDNKIAIWPVVESINLLYKSAPSLQSEKVYLVDSSPIKQELKFNDKKVYPPDIIAEESISVVLLASKNIAATGIMHEINSKFLSVKKIYRLGELLFSIKETFHFQTEQKGD